MLTWSHLIELARLTVSLQSYRGSAATHQRLASLSSLEWTALMWSWPRSRTDTSGGLDFPVPNLIPSAGYHSVGTIRWILFAEYTIHWVPLTRYHPPDTLRYVPSIGYHRRWRNRSQANSTRSTRELLEKSKWGLIFLTKPTLLPAFHWWQRRALEHAALGSWKGRSCKW